MKDIIDPKRTDPNSNADLGEQSSVPPYNDDLDPDNAVSPIDFEEREEEGERKFYPEGGPEDPPVSFPRE